MMVDDVNAALLGETSFVVCLTATPETIYRRVLRGIENRPMLSVDDPRARIAELLAERADGYARFTQVATDDRTVDDIVDEIVRGV